MRPSRRLPAASRARSAAPATGSPTASGRGSRTPDGNGVYTFVSDEIPAGDYEMKAALNEAWDASYPASNVAFTVAADEVVTMTYTASTNAVNVVSEPPPAPETTVALVGSLQDELGCPGDWQPECAATELTLGTDGVWRGDFTVPRRQLGVQGRPERQLGRQLRGGRGIERCEHRADAGRRDRGAVLLRRHDPLGHEQPQRVHRHGGRQLPERDRLPGDWAPDCLRSWLQDIDGNGVYTFATDDIPAGDYEFKVALAEAWTRPIPPQRRVHRREW